MGTRRRREGVRPGGGIQHRRVVHLDHLQGAADVHLRCPQVAPWGRAPWPGGFRHGTFDDRVRGPPTMVACPALARTHPDTGIMSVTTQGTFAMDAFFT